MYDADTYLPATSVRAVPGLAPRPDLQSIRPGNLAALIDRVREAVDAETEGLRTDPRFDLAGSNARKSRFLYDLNKAFRAIGGGQAIEPLRGALEGLKQALARNEAVIAAHLGAVGEVASLLQNAIERSEADGTYSTAAFGRAAGR